MPKSAPKTPWKPENKGWKASNHHKANELITYVIDKDSPSKDKYFTYHLVLGIKSKIIASTTVITINNSGKNRIKLLIKSCGIYKANPIIVDIVLDIISINGCG